MAKCNVGVKNRWTYSLGGIGRDMAYKLFNSQILIFIMLTRNVSIEMLAVIGTIMMSCKVFDALNDPIMGIIIENTRTKFGKFKPWILIGVLTNSIVLVLMFSSNLEGWPFVVFFGIMYVVWSMTYTMNDIGYWSMLPALSSDSKERNKNTSLANLCAAMGGGTTLFIAPLLTVGKLGFTGSVATNYSILTIIICAFFIGCQLLTILGVKEDSNLLPKNAIKKKNKGIKKLFSALKNNDQLRWVAICMLIYNLANSIIGCMMTMYIYMQFKYDGGPAGTFNLLFGLMGSAALILYPIISRKLNRKAMFTIAAGSAVFGYLCFFFTGIAWPMSFYVLAGWGVFISFGQSLFQNILTISIANTVEYNEWKTGERDEGILFSLKPLMSKFADALEIGVITIVYGALGINTVTNKISELENAVRVGEITKLEKNQLIETMLDGVRNSSTLTWMRACMALIPVVLIIIAYIISRRKFTIDEKQYDIMLIDIAAKKKSDLEKLERDEEII